MLPSTGYFKTINCPFYDSGLCERPYCHFKHPRREDANLTSGTAVQAAMVGSQSAASANSEMLQHLVSEAVKKVLAHQEVTDTDKFSQNIVSQVVEGLKPTLGSSSLASSSSSIQESLLPTAISEQDVLIPPPVAKPTPCVYNPTPIAELKKRHIPVASYMPTRNSKIAVKRKTSPDRHKPWLSVFQDSPGMHDSPSVPSYPSVKVGEITYKPTAIVTPSDTTSTQSYIPTAKSDTSSTNSYEDSNSNDYLPKTKEEYRPRSKRRREEYVPKKLKAPLKTVQQLDETVLDQFEPEFEVIDDILTAEKTSPRVLVSEESQDYDLEAEPKFSDDEEEEEEEPVDENAENSTKEANKLEAKVKDTDNNVDEKENEDKEGHKRIDVKDKNNESSRSVQKSSSHSSSKSKGSHSSSKSKDDTSSSKSRERRDSHGKDRSKSKDKSSKDESKKDKDKVKKEHRSSSSNHDRNNKESGSRDRNNKEKHKHNSSSKEKSHSSSSNREKDSHSSKGKHKSIHSSKESSKNKETSRSGKDSSSRDKNKDKHKTSNHDKHKDKLSSSGSKKNKSSSDKSSDKKRSYSHSKSTSSRNKKTERRRGSNGESSMGELEEQDSPARSIRSASPIYDEVLEISDSDHDVEEECLKIFQEYEDSDHPKEVTVKEAPKRDFEEVDEPARKRVAHPSASHSVVRQVGPINPPKRLPNPQQRMYERWRLMKEAAAATAAGKAAAAATIDAKLPPSVPTQLPAAAAPQVAEHPNAAATDKSEEQINGNGRPRIAHVPYATSLALAKKRVADVAIKAQESKTLAQTSKAGARVAHVPQAVPQLLRPEPLQAATQKFPLNVRQHYVNLMQDICVQIYTTAEDAAQRALREEFACHERCKAVAVYKNSCMLAAHRLRKELDQQSSSDAGKPSASGMVSHEAVLTGKNRGSWSVVKTKRAVTEFKGAALYMMLNKWIMTEEQLRNNGFPRPHPDGPAGRAKVYVTNTRNQSILSKVPNERFCCRCGQSYMVDKHGNAVRQQNCIYHWGRKFTIRGEGKYSCCQQYGSAGGCCDAKSHVWEHVDYENLRGYVRTLPKDHINAEDQGVFALDCEMSYTTQGLELTRVTVINEDLNVVYETLVKPINPVIDYNTRFSGITEEQMEGVSTSLLDVQATLLTMFSDKTILIGHSLESDFKTLKLLHDTVVDTSVMFPHKNGYPYKRALRNLCSEYLRKIIQNDVGGHDSNEDAMACMELIMWKVKEEAKLQ